MNIEKAARIVANHGMDAFRTPEGLLCITTQVWTMDAIAEGRAPCAADDRACDAETTLPVDAAGEIDGRALAAWLGY